MRNKLVRFFEYDKVNFTDDFPVVNSNERFVFDKKYHEALSSFHQKGGSNYYSLEHRGIKFKQFVGAMQIHDLTIEVLPKIDREKGFGENDKTVWHGLLLTMLKECKQLKPKSFQSASLKLRSNSILDLYLELYVCELEYLYHLGLIKKYRKNEGNKNALKGSIIFKKQIQENLVHAERFYTRHTIYDSQHLLHQILRQALELCDQLTSSGFLTDRIKRLLLCWPDGKRTPIYPALFKKFDFDRKSVSYKEALSIAKLLLLNQNPDIKGGGDNVLALMFDMNKLWEEFIYRRLKNHEEDLGYKVYQQTYVDFWNSNLTTKRVKPDLILCYQKKNIVIDTKWKVPTDQHPADDDLKQMLVYKLYYHADEALLLYPHDSSTFVNKGSFENDVHHIGESYGNKALKETLKTSCGMAFLNIADVGNLLQDTQFKEKIEIVLGS